MHNLVKWNRIFHFVWRFWKAWSWGIGARRRQTMGICRFYAPKTGSPVLSHWPWTMRNWQNHQCCHGHTVCWCRIFPWDWQAVIVFGCTSPWQLRISIRITKMILFLHSRLSGKKRTFGRWLLIGVSCRTPRQWWKDASANLISFNADHRSLTATGDFNDHVRDSESPYPVWLGMEFFQCYAVWITPYEFLLIAYSQSLVANSQLMVCRSVFLVNCMYMFVSPPVA